MKPTIYDVAEKAGVSIATVSKVVNNTGRISERTRKRVGDIMKQLEYQPNGVAAALTGKKTYTIGVLVPDIANPFFAEVARALENNAREIGYAIILCSTDYQSEREQDYINLLIKKQVDGIIMATEPSDLLLFQKLQRQNMPVLIFSIDSLSISAHVVTTDNVRGGYLAAQYLLDKGHRNVAIIAETNRQSGRARMDGFFQALKDNGISASDSAVIPAKSVIPEARLAAKELLALANRPTAVFATTDVLAIMLLNEARKAGVRVPEDLSVIGFDNTIYAEVSDPGLTTIAQPIEELAKYAFTQLLKVISNKILTGHRIMLSPELIERDSVKSL